MARNLPPRLQARLGRHASALPASRRRKRSPAAEHADRRDGDQSRPVERLTEPTNESRANLVYGQVKILKRGEEWSPAKSDLRSWPFIPDHEVLEWERDVSEFFATRPFVDSPDPSSLPLPSSNLLAQKNLIATSF